jgi:hypothetical protein
MHLSSRLSTKLTIGSQDFILSLEKTLDGSHQDTTLTNEIRVDLLVESGLIHVSRTNTNTKGNSALLSLATDVLENGEGGVDTTTLLEETTDSEARALGGDQDNVNIYKKCWLV